MAQLIKHNLPPTRWLIKKGTKSFPSNYLISQSSHQTNQEIIKSVEQNSSMTKAMLAAFFNEQDNLVPLATKYGEKKYTAKLVTEIIIQAIKWQRIAKSEAIAIGTLAQQIAANITEASLTLTDNELLEIETALRASFSVSILVPDLRDDLRKHSSFLTDYFGKNIVFMNEENTARLRLNILGEGNELLFEANELPRILNIIKRANF